MACSGSGRSTTSSTCASTSPAAPPTTRRTQKSSSRRPGPVRTAATSPGRASTCRRCWASSGGPTATPGSASTAPAGSSRGAPGQRPNPSRALTARPSSGLWGSRACAACWGCCPSSAAARADAWTTRRRRSVTRRTPPPPRRRASGSWRGAPARPQRRRWRRRPCPRRPSWPRRRSRQSDRPRDGRRGGGAVDAARGSAQSCVAVAGAGPDCPVTSVRERACRGAQPARHDDASRLHAHAHGGKQP
mmetsp:Transcript_5214/g.15488  ORF Transcript_5214/g.15488 Transcript_5214/m.15488 type:complete len:247 (+) Transcript_5214:1829-2569(+)